MSLYEEWKDLLENQTDDTLQKFWDEYCNAEISIYTDILENHKKPFEGKLGDLAEKYGCRPAIFEGFLDGIENSLNNKIDVKSMTVESEIDLDIDFEKLYYNMWVADAPHLYGLKAWNNVFNEDERHKISSEYKKSKIYHAPKLPGRNDPCPCGSGKKYKKCCGANAK